jgi:hypothetical protein
MTEKNCRHLMILLATCTFVIVTLFAKNGISGETTEKAVNEALVERTEFFCKDVLPSWLASNTGIYEPKVRSVVVDCFMGNARLAVLGIKGSMPIHDLALSELPATFLQNETGINLDVYRPLAGRTIIVWPQGPKS